MLVWQQGVLVMVERGGVPGTPIDFTVLFDGPSEVKKKNQVVEAHEIATDKVSYLIEGYVVEQTVDRFNGITTHAVYGPGDLLIVRASLAHKVSPLMYRTITDCRYVSQPAGDFFNKATQNPKYSAALVTNLISQLELSHERTENLTLKYATDRVVYRLLFFANRFGTKRGNKVEIQLPITHRLLASTINLSRERASQVMHKLRKSGLIAYTGKRVTLLDIQALEQSLITANK